MRQWSTLKPRGMEGHGFMSLPRFDRLSFSLTIRSMHWLTNADVSCASFWRQRNYTICRSITSLRSSKEEEEEEENANRSVLLLSLSFNSKIFTPNMRTEPHPILRRLLAYSGCRRSKRTCTFKNRNGNKDDQSSSVISAGLLLSCAYLLYSMFASVKACMTQCTLVCICVYASGKGGRADDFESRCSAPNGAQHKKPSAKPE